MRWEEALEKLLRILHIASGEELSLLRIVIQDDGVVVGKGVEGNRGEGYLGGLAFRQPPLSRVCR